MQNLPEFNTLDLNTISNQVASFVEYYKSSLEKMLTQKCFSWENLVLPLMELDEKLERMVTPIFHLNHVQSTEELIKINDNLIALLSDFNNEMGQNSQLYKAIKSIKESEKYNDYSLSQKRVIDNSIKNFKLSGVALDDENKHLYKKTNKELALLEQKFGNNVLFARQERFIKLPDNSKLSGVPERLLNKAKQEAKNQEYNGYLFKLDANIVLDILTYAKSKDLRYDFYYAYNTLASELGEQQDFDNSDIMINILQKRLKVANILGFENYAELSLQTKMAESPKQVIDFLNQLLEKSKNMATKEMEELTAFAAEDGCELKPWDIKYYSNLLQQQRYNISQEDLRVYFPIEKVLSGMFSVVKTLFDLDIEELTGFDSWDSEVRMFKVCKQGELAGYFYLDLYARDNKHSGAWMGTAHNRIKLQDKVFNPVAYLNTNFVPKVGLTHDDVVTLFHEFGHTLHHILTTIDFPEINGTNVAWDAVELPSQFLENYAWQAETLDLISSHQETKEPLPRHMLKSLQSAKNFQSGMAMMRQLEFALLDMELHLFLSGIDKNSILQVLHNVRAKTSLIQPAEFVRFLHAFTHIFAGGYAAGYYSYKWAEVLSSDAFAKFEEKGIFNQEVGALFLDTILSQGDVCDAGDLFEKFRGRQPSVESLLRHSGLADS